ncbi:MAG: Hypothetical protein YggS, proline synthase co-transcribed bacterial homolog PROSC [uncultured Thiotrichaceae bacterium]|uniref:Pyridoxal phosphate homeostasis protein n=1 Tax=uncultured Thiotrichaceae bacterium TaxID=298394 RepID=A0A6S6TAT4_9GAMM|nr:MAG: Hypothetical protein YggS, proline synthase co-transcribed bacterial homolog PROSC [uncultured Thiotrichaceae bacterium]
MSEIICDNLQIIGRRIREAEQRYQRSENSVKLLAVSKTKPLEDIEEAMACGQVAFGENYAQEMAEKAQQESVKAAEWHYIGPMQSNKTKWVAEYATWVHSVDRLKIAKRLHEQRTVDQSPLQVCLQVNISKESSKSGLLPDQVLPLMEEMSTLEHLCIRGLMAIPAVTKDFQAQRMAFAQVRELYESLNAQGFALDTLSMGMTNDMEAAIAEGATMVRIGTAIFGARLAI